MSGGLAGLPMLPKAYFDGLAACLSGTLLVLGAWNDVDPDHPSALLYHFAWVSIAEASP